MQSKTTLADSEDPTRSSNPWLASFSFTGRASRLEFWTITIVTSLLAGVLVVSIVPFPPLGRVDSMVIGPSNGDIWTMEVVINQMLRSRLLSIASKDENSSRL